MSTPHSGFGAQEFQLVLLRRMADFHAELVEDAVRELGADRASMRLANKTWQAMIRSRSAPRGMRRYSAVLGPPESTGEQRLGDFAATAYRWPLPLWPELRFELLTGPGGHLLNEALVRADPATAPTPRALAELRPWGCVTADLARAFPPAVPLEGSAPSRARLAFDAPRDAGGKPVRCIAEFTWGLLQTAQPQYPQP